MFRTQQLLLAVATATVAAVSGSFALAREPPELHRPDIEVPDDRPATFPPDASVELHDADERWRSDVRDNIRRFGRAGLEAISVDVHVWTEDVSPDVCEAGRFTVPASGPRIDVCVAYLDSDLATHIRHKLVLHELAHAWVHAHVPDHIRHEFMTLRGAETWNDPQTLQSGRGTEIAANVIVYALHPDPPFRDEYLCGYELLTGHQTPNGRTDPCASVAFPATGGRSARS